jgi:hypothetical protein
MRPVKLPFLTSELLLALITGSISCQTSFVQQYQARVSVTQAQQPHWVTPLVTVTPRLEQELRTDFVLSFEVFQRLTNPWGTPKTTEVVEDRAFCGSDCGSGIEPYLQRRTPFRAVLCDHFLAL